MFLEFIISVALGFAILGEKIYFFFSETQFAKSFWGLIDIAGLIIIFLAGVALYFKEKRKRTYSGVEVSTLFTKKNLPTLSILLLVCVAIGFSFFLNLNKVTLHWDAVAIYDARAKFLEGGIRFSQMPSLSIYDNLNKYYYLLYPPYTSIAHYFWYKLLPGAPVSVYYSILLVLLGSVVFFFSRSELGSKMAALLTLLTVSNINIFNISIKEYSNLPYTLYLVAGIFLLFAYLKNEGMWRLLFGALLIAGSQWIRFLEPVWLGIFMAFALSLFTKRGLAKSTAISFAIFILGSVQYLSWRYFTQEVARNPEIINLGAKNIFEPVVGMFTGAFFIVVFRILTSWGLPLLIPLTALCSSIFRGRDLLKRPQLLFLSLIIVFCLGIYFLPLYFVSFQSDWWQAVAKSLERSSTFLVPVSGYLILRTVKEYAEKLNK